MVNPRLRRVEVEVGDLVEARKVQGRDVDFSRYADDPVGFIREVLGETKPGPWSAQVEIAEAIRDHPLVVVRSCNAAGKDWLKARLALWWVYCRGGFVLLTGPTERQVRVILMGEVHRAFHRAKALHGELFQMALRVGSDEQRGILAFTSSDASRLTGFHAPRIMAVITEAQGVPNFCFEGVFACAIGDEDRIIAVGNPTAPSGRFFEISRSETWKSIRISAEEHPNVREGREVIPGGVSRAFVERIGEEYGVNSGVYGARVLGEFPDSGEESLFKRSWLDRSAERWVEGAWKEESSCEPILGLDPARYGPDSTVLCVRRGPRLEEIVSWHGMDTVESVQRCEREFARLRLRPRPFMDWELGPWGVCVIDVVGLGAGVHDQLRANRWKTASYNGGQFTQGSQKRFLNLRARSFWHLRELLENDRIALPPDPALFEELLALRWFPTSDGRVQLERKEDLKGRLGRSPDRADSVVMAYSLSMTRRVAKTFEWRR